MNWISTRYVALPMVTGLLWIASLSVAGIVEDRIRYRDEARASISQSHAARQYLTGPTLQIPYEEVYTEHEEVNIGKSKQTRTIERRDARNLIVLPTTLGIDADVQVSPRWRGLFKVNTYRTDAKIHGHWRIPAKEEFPRSVSRSKVVLTAPARVLMPIAQVRGIQQIKFMIGARPRDLMPATTSIGSQNAVTATLSKTDTDTGELSFDLALTLDGSDALDLLPSGEVSEFAVRSNWPHPSFEGVMLPASREVSASGFNANWKVTALATTLPERWRVRVGESLAGKVAAINEPNSAGVFDLSERVTVRLFDPVDLYTLSDRATKYAMLFVFLTLGGFALFELFKTLRIHPMQYVLVGLALIVFFLLLLSLAERIGFGRAYATAAGACVTLITYYLRFVLGAWSRALGFGVALTVLYSALYLLLHSEQNTLLIGTLMIFGLLATLMLLTRHTNWSRLTGHA